MMTDLNALIEDVRQVQGMIRHGRTTATDLGEGIIIMKTSMKEMLSLLDSIADRIQQIEKDCNLKIAEALLKKTAIPKKKPPTGRRREKGAERQGGRESGSGKTPAP
jgi:hypothetical protein